MEKKLSEVPLRLNAYFSRRGDISHQENENPSRYPAYSSPFSFSAGIASGTVAPLASFFFLFALSFKKVITVTSAFDPAGLYPNV